MNTEQQNTSQNRYIPLMRGITDVPTKGDPVLLCTIGGINYYLGPLNTDNSPNFNTDYSFTSTNAGFRNPAGKSDAPTSENFIKTTHRRLQKPNSYLDMFLDSDGGLHTPPALSETHGDLMLEGRHGNSIRIGSRTDKPYIYLSNGRSETSPVESMGDGSLIAMTSFGLLQHHFPMFSQRINRGSGVADQAGFKFGSDTPVRGKDISVPVRTMQSLIHLLEQPPGSEQIPEVTAYGWMKNQILISSDRVNINSDSNNINISSHQNLYLASGKNLAISTNEDMIIESRNIFLGKEAFNRFKETDEKKKRKKLPEPLILGQKLADLLNDLVDILSTMHFLNPVGTPTPMFDSTMTPTADSPNPALNRKSFSDIKAAIESIKSYYHFIEPNNEINKEVTIGKQQ
jgi:hypothetical protein